MKNESVGVRCFLTVVVVLVSVLMFLPLILTKVAEGIYFCYALTKDCVTQVWARRPAQS